MRSRAECAALFLLTVSILPSDARPQGGGFTAGAMFFYTDILFSPTGYTGGIALFDPVTGNAAVSVRCTVSTWVGAAVFDPYRQRLVHVGGSGTSLDLRFSDGSANVTDSGHHGILWDGMSPTGDGRIYFRDHSGTAAIKWLDAANQVHVLYDTDGVTPIPGSGFAGFTDGMIYHAGTNALFVSVTHPTAICPGGPTDQIFVRKLPLTADGTRLAGPVSCASFDVVPGLTEAARGWSKLPDGSLLLLAEIPPSSVAEPRLLRVDPVTLTSTAWASFGGAGRYLHTPGGAYSSAANRAVVFDNSGSELLGVAFGQTSGNGAVIPASIPLGGSAVSIGEIPQTTCRGAWIARGQGLAGTGGQVPRLYGDGCPRVGSSFTIKVDQAVGGAFGALALGAPSALPAFGGTLFVSPIFGSLSFACGGASGVAGAGSFQLPVFVNNPSFTGTALHFQAGLLDGGAVQGIALTNGLQLVFE